MKKDDTVEAVKNFVYAIFCIIMTLGNVMTFFDSASKQDTYHTIVSAFFAIIFGFGTFGCVCSFIDNITNVIAEKSKKK